MTDDEVLGALRALIVESLAVKPDAVRLESRLITDLGADSLDFIDLIFMIEKRFGVKMRDGELDFLSRLDFSSPAVMREGFLTRETVAKLAPWLPALAGVADPGRVTPGELFSFLTVETLCRMVERKLEARA